MKILLVQSINGPGIFPIFPLSLAQLSAQLQGRLVEHQVRGFDPNLDSDYRDSLQSISEKFIPELVGISFRNVDSTQSHSPRSYLPELETLIKEVKRIFSSSIIALGGTGFSLFPEVLMKMFPEIDIGFFLESDNSFPAFADDPSQAPSGAYFRRDGAIHFTGRPITRRDQFRAYSLAGKNRDEEVYVCFLIGCPGEGPKDIPQFLVMLAFLILKLRIYRICISYPRIFPHTGLFRVALEQGVIDEEDDLLRPTFYIKGMAGLFRFLFHPLFRLIHSVLRACQTITLAFRISSSGHI